MPGRNEVRRAALRLLLCCSVLGCSEDRTLVTPAAGSGGSGGVSSSGNAGTGSGGAGYGGASGSAGASGASGSTADERDASPDAADAASFCCTPSPQPECCMVYGGRRLSPDSCGFVCDGMPPPNAGWQLGSDSYGCPVWIEPPPVPNDCCGCPPPDSGI